MPRADNQRWGVHPDAIELTERRTRAAKHFLNPDGTFTGVFSRDLHYEAAPGIWDEVDLALRPDGPDHVMDRNAVIVRATAGGLEVRERNSGRGIRWLTPSRPQVMVGSRRAAVRQHGLDWEYATRKSGVKLTATVAARLGPRTFTFGYQLIGGAADLVVQPDALASDTFVIPRAVMVGANGRRYPGSAWRLLPGNRVEFDWDDSTLPPEAFPYELDPTTNFSVAVSGDDGDAFRTETAIYPPGGSTTVGTSSPSMYVERSFSGGGYSIYVAMARWDTSSIPDSASVTAAVLRISRKILGQDADARSVTADWYVAWPIDATDWTSDAGMNALSGVAISSIQAGTSYDWSLLDAAANVSKTGYTGLRLHVSGGQPTGSNYVEFATFDDTSYAEPQLLVTYTPYEQVGDTGAGSDSVSVYVALGPMSDTGAGSDSVSAYVALGPVSDSGAGAETATVAMTALLADGAATNQTAVGMGGAFDPAIETGAGTDAGTVLGTLGVTDSGMGAELGRVLASTIVADAGTGLDAILDVFRLHVYVRADGTVEPLGVILLRGGREDILPDVRENTESVSGRSGEIDFGADLGSRGLELRVASKDGLSVAQKTELKRYVAQWLRPALGAWNIVWEDDPARYLEVRVAGAIQPEEYRDWLQFVIPLKATNPMYLGSTLHLQTGSGTVVSEGNVDSPATVTITGPVTNPSVTVGAASFTWTGSLGSGDQLVVDGERMTVTKNGVNAVSGFSGTFPAVQPGANTITAAAAGTMTVTWRDHWI